MRKPLTNIKELGRSVKIRKNNCLNCGKSLNGATGVNNNSRPKEGDISLCLYCGHIMMYEKNEKIVELSDKAMREMPSTLVAEMQYVSSLVKRKFEIFEEARKQEFQDMNRHERRRRRRSLLPKSHEKNSNL